MTTALQSTGTITRAAKSKFFDIYIYSSNLLHQLKSIESMQANSTVSKMTRMEGEMQSLRSQHADSLAQVESG